LILNSSTHCKTLKLLTFVSSLLQTALMGLTGIDFGDGYKDAKENPAIRAAMLGFISSCYQLGSVFAIPVAPWLSQRFGRRWSIMIGSIIMVVGALIQGFAQHGRPNSSFPLYIVNIESN
jgi:MFS family permease